MTESTVSVNIVETTVAVSVPTTTIAINDGVGPRGPQGLQGVPGESAGRWTGPYDNATHYYLSDAVGYGGSAYICIQESAGGHNPTDAAYWDLQASKGDDGTIGVDGADGPQGPQGIQGPAGADGPQGIQGPAGADGAQGPAGADGNAADISSETHAAAEKTTPADADEVGLLDSAASFSLARLTWSNIKAALKTYLDTLYSALGHTHPYVPTITSTDNAIARFDGTGGAVQDSPKAWVDDDGSINIDNVTGTDYERFSIKWASNLLSLITGKGGTGTNRDLELNVGGSKLHIKADGSIYLDAAGQTAGNARGAGSIDFGVYRSAATQVASGLASVVFGYRNTASSAYSTAFGVLCVASGDTSFASGDSCTASATVATAIGGGAVATTKGQFAVGTVTSHGVFLTGTAQANIQGFALQTANATPAVLWVDANSTAMTIQAKRAYGVTGVVTAYSDATDGYKVAAWEVRCVIERNASNASRIVGTPTITLLAADADAVSGAWAVTSITVNDANETLAITVTGEAATTIRWQASLFYSLVGY